jgi:hypothetical protein
MCHKTITGEPLRTGKVVLGAAVCATLLGFAPVAPAADDPDLLNDPFRLAIGTYLISSEPSVQLNGETLRGDEVDFDEVLGGGDASRVRLDGDWRFGDSRRHKVRLVAFALSRDNSKTIEREFEWGGDVYPVGAKVDAEFEFAVLEAAYEYAFLRSDSYEVGGTIGLHYTTLDASLKAKSTSTGGTIDVSNSASVDLPLPVIGARGIWKLPHNFWIDAQAQFFALSIDEYDGNLQDYRVMLTWQPHRWLGIGVGYNAFTVDVDVDADKFNGSLDWTYDGPMIFYSASF